MENKFMSVLIICLCPLAGTIYGQISVDSVKAIIEKEVSSKRSKSIVVGIIDANGRKIISAGKLSDTDPRKPDGNTLFEIASVTKLFTTLLLADFSVRNQIGINDPISAYLPKQIKIPTRNGKEISLLHLSAHTSGFPRFPFNYYPNVFRNTYSINEMYEYIPRFKPDFDMGTRFRYSNTGMGLLGHLLSVKSGKTYEELINEKICKPLGMHNTRITLTSAQTKNLATGHAAYGKPVEHFVEGPAMEASGALYSTVNDLLTFAENNLGLVRSNLSAAIDTTHLKRGRIGIELGYDAKILYDFSMGWNIWTKNGKTIYWKDGTSFGFRSFICLDKEKKKAVAILSNCFNPVNDIGLHLIDSTYKVTPYMYEWRLLDTINAAIKTKGADAAIKLYYQLKETKEPGLLFDEMILDNVANDLRKSKRIAEAVKIYELNIKEYPKSELVYESLAELYRTTGNKKMAIHYYQKQLALNPKDEHVIWVINSLQNSK